MGRYKKYYSRKSKSFSGHRDFSKDDEDTKGYSEKHCEQDMSTKLEAWMYRRDREEYILSFPFIDIARHHSRQEEAEQETEKELRR